VNFSSVTPVEATLTFTKPDNGSISTADGKVNCGDTCSASYPVGETIDITASSLSAEFAGWEGDCSGTQNPLSVTITQDMVDQGWSCNATFANEATAEKDCFDVGLGLLISGNECVQADELTTEDFTAAQMRGGISKFGRPFKQRDTVTLIDPIRTAGVIKVDPVDLGKPADIVVIGLHKSEELYPGVGFAWYMMIGDDSELGWTIDILPYDDEGSPQLEESVLPPLMSVSALTDYETIYMYSGNFVYPGPLELFYGYRIIGEKVVLNLEPIQVSILPPPK
ncbi:MAG: hypothetical protein SVR94_18890, partial [Pseudomonadota bacterium]|nr:hypothetical protein [Pseudomonadota bacterium]